MFKYLDLEIVYIIGLIVLCFCLILSMREKALLKEEIHKLKQECVEGKK